jgi:hypothetical protein
MLHYLDPLKGSLHYENNKKDNTYIKMGNPPLERLWDGQYPHISQQKVIVSHVICEILCNMKNKYFHILCICDLI